MRRSLALVSVVLLPLATFIACNGDDDDATTVTPEGGDASRDGGGGAEDGSATGTDASGVDSAAPADASDGGGGGACLGGGTPVTPTGSGTCAAPYLVDLTGVALGAIVAVTATGGADEASFVKGGACGVAFDGTARDLVFHVKMPSAVVTLDVAAEGANADVRLGVAEDPSCGQPLNACANAGGAGACEHVIGPKGGAGFFGNETYVVVSEVTSSGQPLAVRFRAN